MKKYYYLVFVLILSLSLLACSEGSPFNFLKPKGKAKPVAQQPVQPVAQRPIKGALLAQVNDWRIGITDFENRLNTLKEAGMALTVEKDVILDELIKLVLISQEAEKKGYANDPEIKEALEDYRRTILFQKLSEEITKDIIVPDNEVEEFYDQARDFYFKEDDSLKLSEIAVSSETVANDIYMKVAFQGEDFAALARESSLLPSRAEGGDIGWVTPNSQDTKKFKKYWDVASALDKGKVSFVFVSEDSKYYILKLEDKKQGRVIPLSEVKEQIRAALQADKQKKKVDELVEKLKADARIIQNKELLK